MAKKGTQNKLKLVKPDKTPITSTVRCHLVVTRASGDRETYLLAEVPDARYAVEYRRKLAKVAVPKRLTLFGKMPKDGKKVA